MPLLPSGIDPDLLICSMKLGDYAKAVKDFHGTLAPGLLVGGFMVDLAYKHLPSEGFFDAISEASGCLADAIQLLTPCSIGNGWLKNRVTGRFALTMFEKTTGEGVRVFIDPVALERWPTVRDWFLKRVPKDQQDTHQLIRDIVAAGVDILAVQRVLVDVKQTRKTKGQKSLVCPECGESYPARFGEKCGYCSGAQAYYKASTPMNASKVG